MLLDFYHHIKLPHFRAKPLSALYFSFTLRTLAISLVSVFIPIYILNITGDFLWVLVFFAAYSSFVVALAMPLGWLVVRIGFRWSVFVASVLLALELFLFSLAAENILYLWIVVPLEAAKLLLFWIPYHLIFVEDASARHFGEQVSIPGVIARLVAVVAPLAGGFTISKIGFTSVFYLAIFLVLASALPLFFMPHHAHGAYPGWRHILKETFAGGYGRIFAAFWGVRSVALVAAVVWPVFLFGLTQNSYSEVGVITSAVLLVSVVSLLATGRAVDRFGRRLVLRFGAWVNSTIWIVKAFIATPFEAFFVDSLNKLVDGVQGIPFDVVTYEKARRRKHPSEFIVRREMLLHFGGILTTLGMMGLWVLGVPLPAFFLIAALGYLVSMFMLAGD
ncbi:hypothetical protein GTO10_01610 [Candidatus Saccharibacteria bacterium]|nr:hypothetical protein [Candidatus Saccharibacteria bacterium]